MSPCHLIGQLTDLILQTVSAIYAFFLAMTIHPDIQARAQAELDSVVGTDRLPTFDDRDSLPYINAICKEVFRWNVIAPLGAHLLISTIAGVS
jgi:cytochrome P450